MAFDVYVGGFARFYALEWENVAQKWARESGTHYQIIGPNGPPQANDWDEVADAVGHWRAAMNAGLGANLTEPLDWDESRDAPYFTDRPGYDAYGALLVWAANAELGTTPPEVYNGEWYSDETFQKCSKPARGQKYRPLICGGLWLPGTFEFSFDFENLTGEQVHICSNTSLERCLRELCSASFNMTPDELDAACQGDAGDKPTLKALARFGLLLFLRLSEQSVRHHLPIVLSC